MQESPRNRISLIEQKLPAIGSLIHNKEFMQALAELRKLEHQRGPDDLPSESGEFYHLLALALQGVGNYKEACANAQVALDLLKKAPEDKNLAQAQYVLGTIYFDMGKLDKAEQQLKDSVASLRRLDDKKGMVQVLGEFAHLHFVRSDYSKAIQYLTECLSYCDETDDELTKAKIWANLGRIFIRTGSWELAESSLLLAAKIHRERSDKLCLCRGLLSLGYVCFHQRNFGRAKEYYEDALRIIYENNYMREMAIYYEYYGELAFAQGKYFLANDHCRNGIKIGEEIAPAGDIVSQIYRLLAEVQIAERQYDEALSSCEKALKVATSLGERIEIGAIHRALGQIRAINGEKHEAKEHFKKSISVLEEIKAKYELAKTYLEAGKCYALDNPERIACLGEAKRIFRKQRVRYQMGRVDLAFAELLFSNGEYEKAEVFLEEAEEIFEKSSEAKDLKTTWELKARVSEAQTAIGAISDPKSSSLFSSVITQDSRMLNILRKAKEIKDSDTALLVEGEVGTGKHMLAAAIHHESNRKTGSYVKVNCAVRPESFLERELFGYTKGAFSGTDREKKGFIEEADGGTIFLDGVEDLPPRLQTRILDAIEDGAITRIGQTQSKRVDFRVIAGSNRNLEEEMIKGSFRKDLYHRLSMVRFRLPPLRERKGDISLLIDYFLKKHCTMGKTERIAFQADLMKIFDGHDWPGNIRELKNEIVRVIVESSGKKLGSLPASDKFRAHRAAGEPYLDKEEMHLSLHE